MSIEGIFFTSVASGPMQAVASATLLVGKGLEGDRYCENVGTYSCLRVSKRRRGAREPGRQLTLISADSVEAALEKSHMTKPKSLGNLRRNVVIRGLSADDLLGAIGHVVRLGTTCRILVHRNCVPCMYNERKNKIPGLMEAIWNEAGVSCEVLTGGKIAVGDKVEIMLDEKMEADGGDQAPGFYVPPSKRTTDMVVSSLARMRGAKKALTEVDPEGVKRVQASYSSVGLNFWPKDKE
jgi:MOSC domain-containing protein YiiM